tara:strand:+ start:1834 stop:2484 length:651 start_codon:yes stop_codon:yes gene_type:complete
MQKYKIVIVDYGVGNLLSVQRAVKECGSDAIVSSDPKAISKASRVILPGVGAFSNGMKALKMLGLVDTLKNLAKDGIPLLGICLGMQLLLDQSEEYGFTNGLGIMPGRVIPIPKKSIEGYPLKIPHIGWNKLYPHRNTSWENTFLDKIKPSDTTYFVHSYMAIPSESDKILANCIYGGNHIPAVICNGNVLGCQFHPEKSGVVGLSLLKTFLDTVK